MKQKHFSVTKSNSTKLISSKTTPSNLTLNKSAPFLFDKINSFFSRKIVTGLLAFFVLGCLFLLVLVFLMSEEYNSLEKKHLDFVAQSEKEIYLLNNEVSKLTLQSFDLNSKLIELQSKYSSLSSSNAALDKSYLELKQEAQGTISKIMDYESSIKSSLAWFQTNSVFSSFQKNVLLNLKSSCLEKSSSCEINLGCFFLVNKEFVKYSYKTDITTSNSEDKLQSLEDFMKNKGGDCEDFSLFFKAEFNSLVRSCASKPVKLFAWVEKKGSRFWANYSNTWYMDDATKKYFDVNNIFPTVVCGSMLDLMSGKINGHCVIAFSEKEILSSSDISSLESAELIEPQSGKYLGYVGNESGIFLITSPSATNSYINILITNNDLFLYSNGKWNSYGSFGSELLLRKSALENLLIN
ncbi:MAG: hypothetical protein WC821_03205 [archaeon]|jgi:protein associated with RNAse G/E